MQHSVLTIKLKKCKKKTENILKSLYVQLTLYLIVLYKYMEMFMVVTYQHLPTIYTLKYYVHSTKRGMLIGYVYKNVCLLRDVNCNRAHDY